MRPIRKLVRLSHLPHETEGGSLIEFAIATTVLFTFFFCFMELCFLLYTYSVISDVARRGTRYAIVRGATCPTSASPTCEVTAAQVNTFVSSISYPNIGGGTLTPATTYLDGNENVGSRVQVKVTYIFPINMPLVPKNSITLNSSSVMVIVQ